MTIKATTMNPTDATSSRRHDLDALRAAAMLLGIVFHSSLSVALGFGWMVRDVSQSKTAYLFQAWVHGFRMPLFMVVSGFFTAMLWRKRGLKALFSHRFRRVLLPCLLGLATVVPAIIWASSFAFQSGVAKSRKTARPESASANLWTAIRQGDAPALQGYLQTGEALTNLHAEFGITPLMWAALNGQKEAAAILLEKGASPNGRSRDGNTALHAAAFLGRTGLVELLIQKGADIHAVNSAGEQPLGSAVADWGLVQYITGLLGITVEKPQVEQGRREIVRWLQALGAVGANPATAGPAGAGGSVKPSPILQATRWLMDTPVFLLLWFLWFLWWLVVVFAAGAWIGQSLGCALAPGRFLLSPVFLAALVPLAMLPIWFMGSGNGEFGPDTSMGILPMPHVFGYYALFFFFGALYYDCGDEAGRLGRSWRWLLPIATCLVFPLALEFATGAFGFRNALLPPRFQHLASTAFQALYAWLMCFGCMGMFRALLVRENPVIRYLSDASYWLYLTHLPLIIALQALVSDWPVPGLIKAAVMSLLVTGFLLLIYDKLVRYTWVGTLLNGPRKRTATPSSATPEDFAGASSKPVS